MKHITCYVSFALIALGISCHQSDPRRSEGHRNVTTSRIGSIDVEIPSLDGRLTPMYDAVRTYERKLDLNHLIGGYDSLQVRIWYWFANRKTSQLLIIKSRQSEWIAEEVTIGYTFHPSPYDSLRKTTFDVINSRLIRPKTSWRSAMRKLYQHDLLTLPDMVSLNGYDTGIHGNNVVVEIATHGTYRMYNYLEPISYKSRFKEAQHMVAIMDILEEEFGFMRQDFI